MRTIAIACNTLKDEILMIARELKVDYPIIWIESGLHQTPHKLNNGIQRQIDNLSNVDNIILIFGSCGNSLHGLKSSEARIIFPRVDDCIAMFLGGNIQKKLLDNQGHSYYLTKGYLQNEANIWTDYTYSVSRYGEEKARRLIRVMLKNYQKLRVIETGAYDLEEFVAETRDIAKKLELEHEVVKGSMQLLVKALKGDWDQDFVIINPGEQVGYSHLGFS